MFTSLKNRMKNNKPVGYTSNNTMEVPGTIQVYDSSDIDAELVIYRSQYETYTKSLFYDSLIRSIRTPLIGNNYDNDFIRRVFLSDQIFTPDNTDRKIEEEKLYTWAEYFGNSTSISFISDTNYSLSVSTINKYHTIIGNSIYYMNLRPVIFYTTRSVIEKILYQVLDTMDDDQSENRYTWKQIQTNFEGHFRRNISISINETMEIIKKETVKLNKVRKDSILNNQRRYVPDNNGYSSSFIHYCSNIGYTNTTDPREVIHDYRSPNQWARSNSIKDLSDSIDLNKNTVNVLSIMKQFSLNYIFDVFEFPIMDIITGNYKKISFTDQMKYIKIISKLKEIETELINRYNLIKE